MGSIDGVIVGAPAAVVGTGVVGEAVVGVSVGLLGFAVGRLDGPGVGTSVGDVVGAVGSMDGAIEGRRDGTGVVDKVGALVGMNVGDPVFNPITPAIINCPAHVSFA